MNSSIAQTEPDTNYHNFSENPWNEFKQPNRPSLVNGSKRIPGLISATPRPTTMFNRKFNQPQQTVSPHYSQFGEPSELSNFKNIPDLYPIRANVSNNDRSYPATGSLVNSHEQSIFSSTKFCRPNHSNATATPSIIENSNFSLNCGNPLRENALFPNVSGNHMNA